MKIFFSFVLVSVLLLIVYLNVKLYYSPQITALKGDTIDFDLLCELRGLKGSLEHHADDEMQELFPEGYIFFNSLYGLSWCAMADRVERNSPLYNEAYTEISTAVNNVNSSKGKQVFSSELTLPYGAFYTGWTTYLLGRKLTIEQTSKQSSEEIALFKARCDKIATAIEKHLYPVSYYGSAWPADVLLCVSALKIHDKLFEPKYSGAIATWVEKIKQKLDQNGMIPHSVDPLTAAPVENARGSSLGLVLIFLHDLDRDFANEQFALYQKHFVDSRFGLAGIREYPQGTSGSGTRDIDSGPVIMGMGSAATIVGMRVMDVFGAQENAEALCNGVEAFGLPFKTDEKKTYLLGLLPMADAFITWAHTSHDYRMMKDPNHSGWRMPFQLYSAFVSLVIIVMCLRLWKNS
jgi:hypothetical protein